MVENNSQANKAADQIAQSPQGLKKMFTFLKADDGQSKQTQESPPTTSRTKERRTTLVPLAPPKIKFSQPLKKSPTLLKIPQSQDGSSVSSSLEESCTDESEYNIYGDNDRQYIDADGYPRKSQHTSDDSLQTIMNQEVQFQILNEEEKLVIPWFLIRNQSTNKFVWNVAVFVTVVQTTTMVPFRIAFSDDEADALMWTITDVGSDLIFIIDIIITFFVIENDSEGLPIVTLKGIARKYLRGYFAFDMISSIPISTIIYITFAIKSAEQDPTNYNTNFQFVNLIKTFRVYRVVVIMKILRIIRQSKILELITAKLYLTPAITALVNNLIRLLFVVHFIGCIWGIVAVSFENDTQTNWIRDKGIENSDSFERYVTSCYWAVVTICTIGYGEIIPTNLYEVSTNILLMWIGVTTQSYIMSRVTEIFLEKREGDESRTEKIFNFFQKSNVSNQEQMKVTHFFQPSNNLIHQLKQLETNSLMEILPMYLKAECCYYMYKQAIDTIKILQEKDQIFYANKILQLVPMRIMKGTVLGFEGCHLDEIFLLLTGCVLRESKQETEMGLPPHYLIEGTMFGEKEIMFDRELCATYTAMCDCYILKVTKKDFQKLMDSSDPFRNEVIGIARDRERLRIIEINRIKNGEPVKTDEMMSVEDYKEFSEEVLRVDKENKQQAIDDKEKNMVQVAKLRRKQNEWRKNKINKFYQDLPEQPQSNTFPPPFFKGAVSASPFQNTQLQDELMEGGQKESSQPTGKPPMAPPSARAPSVTTRDLIILRQDSMRSRLQTPEQLASRVQSCLSHLDKARSLIKAQIQKFLHLQDTEPALSNYLLHINCGLNNYSNFLDEIERQLKSYSIQDVESEFRSARTEAVDLNNRFYLQQTRLDSIEDLLKKKTCSLEVENEKCISGKVLVKKVRVRGANGVFVEQVDPAGDQLRQSNYSSNPDYNVHQLGRLQESQKPQV